MPTLFLRFPARRYHATPWGHHVNEGLIEWPPSPWRMLRALLSVGYTSGLWNGNGPSVAVRNLIEKLAAALPAYSLPPAAGAHSRHYMPLGVLDKGREKTTLVLDTWAQIDDGEIAVVWDIELADTETALLAQLAERLGYLGRSESWVVARLARPGESLLAINCVPENGHANPGPGWEQVPAIAPLPAGEYSSWRQLQVEKALEKLPPIPLPEKKKLTKKDRKPSEVRDAERAKAEDPYPTDLIACLQIETNLLRRYGWSQPPGSRRVFYWRKTDALESGAPKAKPRVVRAAPAESMLLSMATGSGNDHALPSITRTLPQAELLHRALVSFAAKQGVHSPALTGCDEKGKALRGPHEHAHILPLDLDGDGHLEHILLWAPMGFSDHDRAAVRALRQTFTKGGIGPLRLAITGAGNLSDLASLPGVYGDGLRLILDLHASSTLWRSRTPFVPARHLKKRGRDTIEGQIAFELTVRGFPPPTDVKVLDPHNDERARRHRHFVRSRRHGPDAPIDCGFTLELRFPNSIRGPVCLGYGSHFGLGLFAAVPDTPDA